MLAQPGEIHVLPDPAGTSPPLEAKPRYVQGLPHSPSSRTPIPFSLTVSHILFNPAPRAWIEIEAAPKPFPKPPVGARAGPILRARPITRSPSFRFQSFSISPTIRGSIGRSNGHKLGERGPGAMKGRAQRAAAEAPEDWGDGAWTVDCSCGVTFDDGEEMVSCDECGVWVHTRCARFTRGQPSFACHKCKRRASTPSDDAEETEVAQLLVELPTKAGADPGPPQPLPGPRRPPFRLWAEVPMEERVHVQGVPGGDPALFRGLSSVFTSRLWKCAGYVPKKFNFKYKEFPCWEEEAVVESKKADEEEEGENPASRGANVLFSLSKESVPYVPAVSLDRWPLTEMSKKRDGGKVLYGSRSQSSGKRERSKLRVFGVHSGKRRKDESGDGNDRSTRKKARSMADRALSDDGKRGE